MISRLDALKARVATVEWDPQFTGKQTYSLAREDIERLVAVVSTLQIYISSHDDDTDSWNPVRDALAYWLEGEQK